MKTNNIPPSFVKQMMFGTLVMEFNLKITCPEVRDPLLKEIKKWIKKDPGVVISNMGGWHSPLTHTGVLGKLTKIIADEYAPIYGQAMGWDLDNRKFFSESGAWANVNPPGASNNTHVHCNSVIAAIYYVETHGPEQGSLFFEDPRSSALQNLPAIREVNYLNTRSIERAPQDHDLLLFPPWLPHRVALNKSKKKRISVSVNFSVGHQ
tara:strand:+ start:54 stop:677 length:624 start_codon:yes stop_codon:yes gene_type:complete